MIGFYKNKETNNINENNQNSINKWQITLFIILVICSIILLITTGIFLGVYLFKKKRKAKYILDEDYDYTTQNNEAIN